MKLNRKFIIILFLVIVLPALFFSVYEIGSLSRNEEIIEEIYNNQLEGILSSVNQYSESVTSNWAIYLNSIFSNPQHDLDKDLRHYIHGNPSMKGVFFIRDTSSIDPEIVLQDFSLSFLNQRKIITSIVKNNPKKINRLYLYLKGRYRKVEPFVSSHSQTFTYLFFVVEDFNGKEMLCGLIINDKDFVTQILHPKIQSVVQDKFIINIIDERDRKFLYSSETSNMHNLNQTKPLWFLPRFKLGIIYKGRTIQDLVRERTYLNFALIVLIDLLFLIGAWILFKNLKTEIQLSQMRSDFISNVSHEIRTPLALISVYTETILLGRVKPEKLKEYHEIIHQETNRLTDIVNKILNFSKIEEKKYQYNFTPQNLNTIVSNIIQRFDYHLKNKSFVVETSLAPGMPEIMADYDAIYEVLMNLIDNAIKYSLEEKYLCVETFVEKDDVVLTVTDHGIGIPEPHQKYVFDRFFRVPDGEIQKVRGSGLGLAIVKQIIEEHHGTIVLNSAFGKGSAFRIMLPIPKPKH
jgi:two-component system, OmpR family, phosphate regulon sensor histidine kinase PhoR